MRRRDVIKVIAGSAVAWPLTARAQPSLVRPLIGLLSPLSAVGARRNVSAFRSALRDLGYVEGSNVTLALRYGDGASERMLSLARDLITLNPDVIVAGGNSGALATYKLTRTIPIVAIIGEDPVTAGFAQSVARPGANVTGTWVFGDDALVGKGLDFLRLAVPGLARIGGMFNPDDPVDELQIARASAAARAAGVSMEVIQIRDLGNLESVATEITRTSVQGLFFGVAPFWLSARTEVTAMVARLNLPAVYPWREFADAGGLMSYGPNLPEMYRLSARSVDKILKGTRPGDLPFELPTRNELIVNLKTAKAMGLNISESFLVLADEVIE
jgi:putative tryptophan/tyrosine transport system substrate-binding protein